VLVIILSGILIIIVLGLDYWSYMLGRQGRSDSAGDIIPVTYFFVGVLLAGMIQGTMRETVTLIVSGLLLCVINFSLYFWGKQQASQVKS